MKNRMVLAATMVAALAGCAQPPTGKYMWGNYALTLYDYQQDATKLAQYQEELERLAVTDPKTQKIAPGVFAELGYVRLAKGDVPGAVAMFEREKTAWPESTVFMDKAITAARNGTAAPKTS